MTTYRIRLRDSGKVERVQGESYTIDPAGILAIYRNNQPIAEYAPRAWAWVKSVTDA